MGKPAQLAKCVAPNTSAYWLKMNKFITTFSEVKGAEHIRFDFQGTEINLVNNNEHQIPVQYLVEWGGYGAEVARILALPDTRHEGGRELDQFKFTRIRIPGGLILVIASRKPA